MKKILLFVVLLSVSLHAGLFSAAVNAASRHKTKEYNKGVEAYNQALTESDNNNNKKAAVLFATACDKKVYEGCWNAGILYEDYNALLSAIYYKKSCDNGGSCLLEEDQAQTTTNTTNSVSAVTVPRCSDSDVVALLEQLLNKNSMLGMIGKASDITVDMSTVRESSSTGSIRTCKADMDLGLDEEQKRKLEADPALRVVFGSKIVAYEISITDDRKSFYVEIIQ